MTKMKMGGNESKNKSSGLKIASQAEILRARQRDEEFVNHLRNKFSDLSYRFPSFRSILPFFQSDVPFKLVYFIVTSGLGNQTLGEEYTGIVQANLKYQSVPSMSARILAALLECFGERGLIKLLERLRVSINNPRSKLRPEATALLNKFIARLKISIPLLILIHRGLFYTFGRYYTLGRRLAGVDYARVQGKRSSDGVSWGLRILGAITLAECALRFYQNRKIIDGDEKGIEIIEDNSLERCRLCLEGLPTAATPCGHLFCWDCLGDWLRTRQQCPLCRERVASSRIVHLTNL